MRSPKESYQFKYYSFSLSDYNTKHTRNLLCYTLCIILFKNFVHCTWFIFSSRNPRDAMHKCGLCRHAVSVRLSVTFVDRVKTNKHIFEIFSPSGSHTILVFPYQTGWRYSDGNPPNGGVECRCGRQKRYSGRIYGFAAYRSTVLSTVRVAKCEKQSRDERRQASSTHRGVHCSHKTTTKCL